MIAKIAVEKTSIRFDRLFDYAVPDHQQAQAKIGCRVSVPFGNANQYRQGVILDIKNGQPEKKLKIIAGFLDDQPILSSKMVDIVFYLVHSTFCTYYEAIRTILPAGFSYFLKKSYQFTDRLDGLEVYSPHQLELLSFLRKAANQQEVDRIVQHQLESGHRADIDFLIQQQVLIPSVSSKRKLGDKTVNMVKMTDPEFDPSSCKLSQKQKKVVSFLLELGVVSIKEVCYFCGVTDIVVKNLAKQGIVTLYEQEVYRTPYEAATPTQKPELVLTPQQQQVLDGLLQQYYTNRPSVALLHGITGSGKTQVFLKLIEKMIQMGKQTILMVPEISLTPQMLQKFQLAFGSEIAVMHSSLSMGEQMDEYKRIKNGEVKIVIGTRSAVFAPLEQLGLIIMDEEGESTYKSSDMSPRYHTRDVAKYRCIQQKALLLLASATPSVESYYAAKQGVYSLYELNQRYADAQLPEVTLIDMRQEPSSLITGVSEYLAEEIARNLQQGEQSILLLNRRGYRSVLSCVDCGWVAECPHCSVGMTYHRANGYLMCHYCGYSQELPKTCPECGGNHLMLTGQGTQKIEEEVQQYFPDARVLRMDADTTFTRSALESKIQSFSKGEYDILIGTQIVAKGLDFPNVTLVGVLSADSMLFGDDFKCHEHAFSMLTQVVGRSGRGGKKGRAYIQTYNPDHPVIRQAASQDYQSFYQDEIVEREAFFYPPFCDICLVGITGRQEQQVDLGARLFLSVLKQATKGLRQNIPMKVLGRSKPYIYKMNNKYRQRIILKCRNNTAFRQLMRKVLVYTASRKECSNLHLYCDINGEIN